MQPNFTNQITMLTIPTNHTEGHRSQAVAIVDDEGDCVCSVCLEIIIGTQNRCSKCLSTCHDSCIDGASDDDDSGICLSYCATEAQIHQQSVSSQSNDQSRPDQSIPNTTAISCDRSGMQTSSQLVSDQANSQSVTDINHVLNPTSRTDAQGVNIGVPVKTNTNTTSCKDKMASYKAVIKLRQVRQLEAKLKKWEEDLKLREAKVTNRNVDSRRMEEYVSKTEACNVELEATVRTLKRKICLLENEVSNLAANRPAPGDKFNSSSNYADPPLLINSSSNQHSADCSNNAYTKETNDLVLGIQQQVTRFVLNKVSQQINRLELDQEQKLPHRFQKQYDLLFSELQRNHPLQIFMCPRTSNIVIP